MNKTEIIKKFASDEDDRLLLSKALDKLQACDTKQIPTNTRFLTMPQQQLTASALNALGCENYRFFGGYDDAERKILVFLPDWLETVPLGEDCPIAALRSSFSGELTHPQLLGALMSIGLTRDCIGDLLITPENADIFVLREHIPYVMDNLSSAGRNSLSFWEIPLKDVKIPEESCVLKKDTVASLRLDALVASGFSMSREKAAMLIRSGKVTLDWQECIKPDKSVTQGSRVTASGYGKIVLEQVGGISKKGRIGIVIKQYK